MSDAHPQARMVPGAAEGHESDDINVGGLLVFLVVLVLFIIAVLFLLAGVMRNFAEREKVAESARPARFRDESGQFPQPQLQEKPASDLRVYRAEEHKKIDGYGWVDAEHKVARIPVDRALQIVAKRGLPSRKTEEKKEARQP